MARPSFTREELDRARANTQGAYERGVAGWERHRTTSLRERPWLERFLKAVPADGRVLDLGCGTGDPIAGYLLAEGRQVHGIDFSEPMLAVARSRYPDATFEFGDMRSLTLDGSYEGALSWDGSFHLTINEQLALIETLAGHLLPGAPLMMTIGDERGETIGRVDDEPIYHASLAHDEYRELLADAGFTGVDIVDDQSPVDRIVLFAVKG